MTQFSDPLFLGGAPTLIASNGNGGLGVGPLSAAYVYDIVPAAVSTTNLATAQTTAGAANLVLTAGTGVTVVVRADGTTAYQLDVPRNVTLTSTGALSGVTFTVSGYDLYGQAMTQTVTGPANSTVTTLKAFYQVVSIATSAAVGTNTSAGVGNVLGMPFVIPQVGYIGSLSWASALGDDTGTFVAADTTTPATSATGDVRGTYAPSSNADGTKRLVMEIMFSQAALNQSATRVITLGVDQA